MFKLPHMPLSPFKLADVARLHSGASGDPYSTKRHYLTNMSTPSTYGTASEIKNPPYPNYSTNYWSCSGHPRSPYLQNYPAGGQTMEPYTNGSYAPHYAAASVNPQYPGCPPSNPYYTPPSQPNYPVDPYKQSSGTPQGPSQWGYPQHGGHNIPPQAPGYPQYPPQQEVMPPYSYREAAPGLPQHTMPQPNPQGEGWGVYGIPNQYQWSTAPSAPPNQARNPYVSGGRPSWQGGDTQPPAYDSKDLSQTANYNQQRPYQGYPENPQPNPAAESQPYQPNAHYSASPQIYSKKEPTNQEPKASEEIPSPDTVHAHPGILKVNQVVERIGILEKEVDEYVGMKTDMSYRCLEELLTKELLELDSVETGGQDNVRQARKEAVKKLQSILENLERKGL
uniref:BAG cochaperone 4 n=1 Tax=Leptobrachium leishanense TaxID=445787 RepID=A0A8C5PUT3_9ANUR